MRRCPQVRLVIGRIPGTAGGRRGRSHPRRRRDAALAMSTRRRGRGRHHLVLSSSRRRTRAGHGHELVRPVRVRRRVVLALMRRRGMLLVIVRHRRRHGAGVMHLVLWVRWLCVFRAPRRSRGCPKCLQVDWSYFAVRRSLLSLAHKLSIVQSARIAQSAGPIRPPPPFRCLANVAGVTFAGRRRAAAFPVFALGLPWRIAPGARRTLAADDLHVLFGC